jgi:glycine reductase complex component B subunit alpha and beta
MRLELSTVDVRALVEGDATTWHDGLLVVDTHAAAAALTSIPGVATAEIAFASPGESARIIHALDAVEPRRCVQGAAYPGIDGPVRQAGEGLTHRFGNVAAIVSCEVPWRSRGGLLLPREGIIEMSGSAAMYSPFSETHNVVAVIELVPDADDETSEQATRTAAFRLASHLATALTPDAVTRTEQFELQPTTSRLPRVVYIYQVQSQALWARTFFYGHSLDEQLPLLVHPNEILDGALASGNQVYQNHKIPTWLHANNPVVRELYERHGQDLEFAGVILSKGYFYSDEAKHRSAMLAARLAAQVGAEGAVVTWEGGGNSIVEAMLTVQACEQRGIRTTLIAYEMGGTQQMPLIFSVPEADAIVSSANTEAPVHLPPVERVVGGTEIRLRPEVGGVRLAAAGPLPLEATYEMYCAANRLGAGRFAVETF